MPTIVAMSRKRTPGHARCIPGPGHGWSEKARWFEVCSSSRLEEAGALDGREKSCRRSFLSLRNPRRRVKYPPPRPTFTASQTERHGDSLQVEAEFVLGLQVL